MARLSGILGTALLLLVSGNPAGAVANENRLISTYGVSSTTPVTDPDTLPPKPGSMEHENRTQIVEAIRQASRKTGTDYAYLLAMAQMESGLDPKAQSRTSSARGLFQFLNSTWLAAWDMHSHQLELDQDDLQRSELLERRDNPFLAAQLAGALAQDSAKQLKVMLGRDASYAELYLTHFLGNAGASRFISQLNNDPTAPAAHHFEAAARANRPIFHFDSGRLKSFEDVMEHFESKIAKAIVLTSENHSRAQESQINYSFQYHGVGYSKSFETGGITKLDHPPKHKSGATKIANLTAEAAMGPALANSHKRWVNKPFFIDLEGLESGFSGSMQVERLKFSPALLSRETGLETSMPSDGQSHPDTTFATTSSDTIAFKIASAHDSQRAFQTHMTL